MIVNLEQVRAEALFRIKKRTPIIASSPRRYTYVWGNNSKRLTYLGRKCKILTYGKMRSVLLEFTDNGERTITDRRAVHRIRLYRPARDTG